MRNRKLPKHFKQMDGHIWLVENDRDNMKLFYRVKEILSTRQSHYQQINIIDSYDFGRCLVLDGVMQTTELDGYIYNEMISHVPLLTHPNPKKVLIIGGGDCGVANELTKYSQLERIDLVEIDRLVVEESINRLPRISGNAPRDRRVNMIFQNGIEFVKGKNKMYDIVIIDSSDPVGPAAALFSEEFYADVKACLKEDGLMACQSQSPIFNADILANTYNSLKKRFQLVKAYKAVVPSYPGGMWSFMLASQKYDPAEANLDNLPSDTRYLTKELFVSAFVLPKFMQQSLLGGVKQPCRDL
jgi:spermidine synthase